MSTLNTPPIVAGVVRSVQIGRGAPLGPDGIMSGFVKRPVAGRITVQHLGLIGDEQMDLSVHGGPDKAVYGYSQSNYAKWRNNYPQHEALLVPGGLGENLTIEGCDETQVCFDDVVRIGTVLLQISQPRQPCFKFALRFNDITMPRAMVRNGFSGWYYRVLEAGDLAAGDQVLLVERPHPHWPISRINWQIIQRKGTAADRAEFADLASLRRPVA